MAAGIQTEAGIKAPAEYVTRNVLTNAVEGGIGYWATLTDSTRGSDLLYEDITIVESEEYHDDPKNAEAYFIDSQKIMKAINVIAKGDIVPEHLTNKITALRARSEEKLEEALWSIDAEAADVIVQVAAFGKLVYG